MHFYLWLVAFILTPLVSSIITSTPDKEKLNGKKIIREDGRNVVDNVNERNGGIVENPECVSKVCDMAMCAIVDDWTLFDQTCQLLNTNICPVNVDKVMESISGSANSYNFLFAKIENLNKANKVPTTLLANITCEPIVQNRIDSASYAMSGKMRYFKDDGSIYCGDDEKKIKKDCYYDVRLMSHQGVMQVQLRHESDLELGKPSATKPPFACLKLCSPSKSNTKLQLKTCSSDQFTKDNNCF